MAEADLSALLQRCRRDFRDVVVDAFIVDALQERILLQKRSPHRRLFPGYWDPVGGHLEVGESIAAGLAREVFEETKMRLDEVGPLVHEFVWPEDPMVVNLQFLCRASGTPSLEAGKVSELRWVSASDLPDIEPNLSSSLRQGLGAAFATASKWA